MTTEEKALALVNAERARIGYDPSWSKAVSTATQLYSALLTAIEREQAAIERHEADKKAFSDAVKRFFEINMMPDSYRDCLSPFILPEPEPDPLVEIAREMTLLDGVVRTDSQKAAIREGRAGNTASDDFYDRLRTALPARGYKIERIEQ